MLQGRDFLRPHHLPAQVLYDAFQAEARLRNGRPPEVWIQAEIEAVWKAANAFAVRHGLEAPTMDVVQRAESYAQGSIDYGSKWAIGIVNRMKWPIRLAATE